MNEHDAEVLKAVNTNRKGITLLIAMWMMRPPPPPRGPSRTTVMVAGATALAAIKAIVGW